MPKAGRFQFEPKSPRQCSGEKRARVEVERSSVLLSKWEDDVRSWVDSPWRRAPVSKIVKKKWLGIT